MFDRHPVRVCQSTSPLRRAHELDSNGSSSRCQSHTVRIQQHSPHPSAHVLHTDCTPTTAHLPQSLLHRRPSLRAASPLQYRHHRLASRRCPLHRPFPTILRTAHPVRAGPDNASSNNPPNLRIRRTAIPRSLHTLTTAPAQSIRVRNSLTRPSSTNRAKRVLSGRRFALRWYAHGYVCRTYRLFTLSTADNEDQRFGTSRTTRLRPVILGTSNSAQDDSELARSSVADVSAIAISRRHPPSRRPESSPGSAGDLSGHAQPCTCSLGSVGSLATFPRAVSRGRSIAHRLSPSNPAAISIGTYVRNSSANSPGR